MPMNHVFFSFFSFFAVGGASVCILKEFQIQLIKLFLQLLIGLLKSLNITFITTLKYALYFLLMYENVFTLKIDLNLNQKFLL